MAITSFIPKVWSARLLENLLKALVFGSLCNRNWEGDIAQWGDTVHINSLSDITVKPYTPSTDIDDPEQLSGADARCHPARQVTQDSLRLIEEI